MAPQSELPPLWVSIDPGDSHVGFAVWNGPRCISAVEFAPGPAIRELERVLEAGAGLVVVEKYQLYGWAAQQQAGSDMKTAQLIGVIRYLANKAKVPSLTPLASQTKAMYKVPALILMPARWWRSWGHGSHAKDAEAVGLGHIHQHHRPIWTAGLWDQDPA